MSLQPYQQIVAIGATASGEKVYASLEFTRYISQYVFERIGGVDAMTNTELGEAVYEGQLAPPVVTYSPDDDLTPPVSFPAQEDDLTPPVSHVVIPEDLGDARVAALEAEVAALRTLVNDLLIGNQP